MSSKQRTLSGLTVGDFDELTVEDDFSLLGALKAGEIQTTGDISCTNLSATTDISANTGVLQTLDYSATSLQPFPLYWRQG